ncbi:hypothetical protein K4749_01300 [Streptomyces sp. TRM72054]|uniref:hypothetical protein n=1 Tax=Streptomyces sp. TRM72054 TaxID=2870562 RepID=UPI001C8C039D|nr:hypothetical protein [Streptomyces sp. TRM72054]MBX9392267.1 hypothetical protein [Streptomyces sp. TRM72054]
MTHPNDHPRLKHNGRFQSNPGTDARAAQAAQLKADNPHLTYQQIADAVGYNNKGDAWRAIQRCRQAVLREAGAELIASEAQQLDDLFVAAMEVLERDHVVVSHGRVVCGEDGRPLLDDGPKLAALREMRQIRESYRRLFGVDQPSKVEHSGEVRFELVGVDPTDVA